MPYFQSLRHKLQPTGKRKFVLIMLAVTMLSFALTEPAFAYIDPSTGGALYQLLMPIVALVSIGYAVLKRRISAAASFMWERTFRSGDRSTKTPAE